MLVIVEKTSPYGIMVDGAWLNWSKFHAKSLDKEVKSGDTVEVDIQKDKFIVSCKKITGSAPVAESGTENKAKEVGKQVSVSHQDYDKQAVITRLSCLSTAFGEPLAMFGKTMDSSEALQSSRDLAEMLYGYAMGGAWNKKDEVPL